MNKYLFSLVLVTLNIINIYAQNSSDVLRFSMARTNSTARFEGAGSSFGAVGADQSSIGINPAGLGLFRKSDLSISLYRKSLEGEYLINPSGPIVISDNKLVALSNLGLVISQKPTRYSNWSNVNYYIGYNNSANFDQNISFNGKSKGSILHRFLENAIDPRYADGRGLHPDELDAFESGLAYETGALFDVSNDSTIYTYTNDLLEFRDSMISKNGEFVTDGFLGNLSFGLAGNYKEKFIFGGSLEIPLGSLEYNKNYNEIDPNNTLRPFKNLNFNDRVNSEISGLKVVLGMIYKPINNLRLGLSWHSPMWLSMIDNYNTSLSYSYYDSKGILDSNTSNSPDGVYNYSVSTPSKWIGSIAYVSKIGFINVDVDYFNPGNARFHFEEPSEQLYEKELNNDIDKQYKSVLQTRIGLEVPFDKFRFRGGFGFLSSPYENESEIFKTYSAGFGYRRKHFFIDLSGRFYSYKEAYIPFRTGNSDFNNDRIPDAVESLVLSTLNLNQYTLTLGFKF
ncbi:MAG: hypothetical protein HOP11_02300 [Saprospiraceae bacterium]|nr:hypothetical protein [Saprospiraceae bacterium]